MPTVSVIITTYNRSLMLSGSIQSVLEQTFKDFELIIVDDCSTDNTTKIVSNFKDSRIKYIRLEKNSGGCLIPRTIGLGASRGKYIAVLDDDDLWVDRRKLELQVLYLDSDPGCVLVGTDAIATDDNGRILSRFRYPKDDSDIRNKMLTQNCFFHSSVVYRAETASTIGGYIMQKRGFYKNYANDYDLWCKMGLAGKLANLPVYGVSFTPPLPSMNTRLRLELLGLYLEVIRNYKDCYPNYRRGILAHIAATTFELPVIAPLKKYFRGFKL